MAAISWVIQIFSHTEPLQSYVTYFILSSCPLTRALAPILEHRSGYSVFYLSQEVELLGQVISWSQGLYLNTGQHKHRKTRAHIKHPCPGWDSNLQSRPPSCRKLFMHRTTRLPRPAYFTQGHKIFLHVFLKPFVKC
jgi:hypothetical protein